MHVKNYLSAVLYGLPVLAQNSAPSFDSSNSAQSHDHGDHFKEYTIQADQITAKLIPYGARLTSLLVPDRNGQMQDVVVGYDDPKQYLHDTETDHTFFGAVVGRYANRIKNGTFTIDGKKYNIPKSEDGVDTLHGGDIGYDQRNWTVTDHSKSSITFTLMDKAEQGFPGDVITHAMFSLDNERTPENPKGLPQLTTKLVSLSLTEKTPVMMSNHIYWNLNGFKKQNVLDDTFLQLPLSSRLIGTDGILIPDGTILEADTAYNGSPDFTSGKLVGADLKDTHGLCGTDCVGYDNCFIIDRPPAYAAQNSMVPAVRMNSSTTGISLEVATNQQAVQIYACNGQKGNIPVKESQIKRNHGQGAHHVNKHGCVVIEPEGWIDGINHPEWGQLPDQIYAPGSAPAVNWATYQFGTIQ
ncbi:Aldose 1-epimerase [Aspergillus sclerotialis]|uniref:Aldose 1-epimerase n=1 Tax=Aspergillus sclerotialis TaxID=2070753 RepID=A0A3A2ZR49_9EURO|nr:Aldose 1-epimerase [Aspergillus sclerotialis]